MRAPSVLAGTLSLAPDTLSIARAMALLWTYRPRTAILQLVSLLESRREDGRAFTHEDVKSILQRLRVTGMVDAMPNRDGFWRLNDRLRGAAYRDLLESAPVSTLRAALHQLDNFDPRHATYRWPLQDYANKVALVRLELHSGASPKSLIELFGALTRSPEWERIVEEAVFPAFDATSFERITETWRWDFVYLATMKVVREWRADLLPMCEWAIAKLDEHPGRVPEGARLALSELLLHRGERTHVQRALDKLDVGGADAIRACLLGQEGRWKDMQPAFEAAWKRRQSEVNARKRLLPSSLSWLYPLGLLAQQTPGHLALGRKFCVGEAGRRDPSPWDPWGLWVHSIDVRLGDTQLEPQFYDASSHTVRHANLADLWRLLLAAWIGGDTLRGVKRARAGGGDAAESAAKLREMLAACGFHWLVSQVDDAEAVLRGKSPSPAFFVPAPSERWRDVLLALQALGNDAASPQADAQPASILWAIELDRDGTVESIEPFEQKRGARGMSRPKPLTLAKIAGNAKLPPWDAKVARAIRQDRYQRRHFLLDRAVATMALIGHPAVVLAEAPERRVELVEGTPEIEVVKDGDGFKLRVTPPLRVDVEDDRYGDPLDRAETEALKLITVVRDSPQRLRVIRMTAAQRRAAQLVADRFVVPASAQPELQRALHALASHFQVHGDHAQAAREVAPESKLRAELVPTGNDLGLRLVVAPLGADGPRLQPGSGRPRLMAAVGDEPIGTRRDLDAERANLDKVLAALPFLDETGTAQECDWLVTDPERALEIVEKLPALEAVAALDWPKGKRLRVATVDTPQVGVTVRGARDWFQLSGSARIDEGLALDFRTLLAAADAGTRFIPIGEGVYAALTRKLRQQLADLASVAEVDGDEVRVPRIAAAWIGETLDGANIDADARFTDAIRRLQRAQDDEPALPTTLQAELRPYQEDGFRWAMRLASTGMGGCLADDMGLGKTLQGLAVLLARAAGGAALVIAPTSVCGNWVSEMRRFAPTLEIILYGEGAREAALAGAKAMSVVVVSYTLLQQARESFTAHRWHTVIADEAQAIKNAAAKRSLAVFDLDCDFRLALSGTPIENRLAELWSIMRFANPGLLGTLPRFAKRFSTPIERTQDRDAQQRLKRLIGPFLLRRTKSQVLQELPARTESVISVTPGAEEAAHYEALRREAVAASDRALATTPLAQARINILAQLMRLRRTACDPRLTSPDLFASGAKVQAFAELATELVANGHKALVFSQFVDFLKLLREPLDQAGIAYQYLDGSTPAAERTRRVEAFQSGQGELFLISLKAGGFGLNLTAADYVLVTDPWWNPAAEDQAMGRAHRIGQSRPVTAYRLVTQGTIEERIVELHRDKRALAEGILADGEVAALPSVEELIALMRGR